MYDCEPSGYLVLVLRRHGQNIFRHGQIEFHHDQIKFPHGEIEFRDEVPKSRPERPQLLCDKLLAHRTVSPARPRAPPIARPLSPTRINLVAVLTSRHTEGTLTELSHLCWHGGFGGRWRCPGGRDGRSSSSSPPFRRASIPGGATATDREAPARSQSSVTRTTGLY